MTSNQNTAPVAPHVEQGNNMAPSTYDAALLARLDRLRPYAVEAVPVRVTVMVEHAFRNFSLTPTGH